MDEGGGGKGDKWGYDDADAIVSGKREQEY